MQNDFDKTMVWWLNLVAVVVRGVARILEKERQKCKVIAHEARNILVRKPCPPVKSRVTGYSLLIHLTRPHSLEVSEKFVLKETAGQPTFGRQRGGLSPLNPMLATPLVVV